MIYLVYRERRFPEDDCECPLLICVVTSLSKAMLAVSKLARENPESNYFYDDMRTGFHP